MNQHGVLLQQLLQAVAIAERGALEYVQGGQAGEEEIPDQGLAAVDAPQKGRDALGVSGVNKRRIFFHSSGDFRRLATADQVEETLTHRPRLAPGRYSWAWAFSAISMMTRANNKPTRMSTAMRD